MKIEYFIFGGFIILFLAIIIYYGIKRSRYKISINLEKGNFNVNEEIKGSFNLILKDDSYIKSLSTGVIAEKKIIKYNDATRSEIARVYSDFKELYNQKARKKGEYDYPINYKIPYNFFNKLKHSKIITDFANIINRNERRESRLRFYFIVKIESKNIVIEKRKEIFITN